MVGRGQVRLPGKIVLVNTLHTVTSKTANNIVATNDVSHALISSVTNMKQTLQILCHAYLMWLHAYLLQSVHLETSLSIDFLVLTDYALAEPGVVRVIHIFCATAIVQNMKITWETRRLRGARS